MQKISAERRVIAVVSILTFIASANAGQIVFLDFDTYTEPGEHVYTPAERMAIKTGLDALFLSAPGGGAFGIEFTLAPPPPFTASIVKFNKGLSTADQIDFRNLDHTDDVELNVPDVLSFYVGAAKDIDFGGGTWSAADFASGPAIIKASTNLAAHEVGHILGLRHHDAFGPITAGIAVSPASYTPIYPGPTGSTNASRHIMAMASSVALNPNNLFKPIWFSERSALKLTIDKIEDAIGPNPLVTLIESTLPGGDVPDGGASAATLVMLPVVIPNTTQPPDPFGNMPGDPTPDFPTLTAKVGIATGKIEMHGPAEAPDVDFFTFEGVKDNLLSIEVISHVMASDFGGRFGDWVNPHVELLDFSFTPLDYGGGAPSVNDDQFESLDSILLDVLLPYTGTYYIEVASGTPLDSLGSSGDYELLAYSFAVPEPTSALLFPMMLAFSRMTLRKRIATR
jgi:hypothetical protein